MKVSVNLLGLLSALGTALAGTFLTDKLEVEGLSLPDVVSGKLFCKL